MLIFLNCLSSVMKDVFTNSRNWNKATYKKKSVQSLLQMIK